MDTTCSICLDDEYNIEFGFKNSKYITKCNHQFHHGCISKWYKSSILCPNCRSQATCCVPVSQNLSFYDYNNINNINNIINNINNINNIINNINININNNNNIININN